MFDESDVSQEKQWLNEQRAQMAVANIQKRKMNAIYVPNRKEALTAIMAMIPEGAVVGRADSVTLEQVGIIPALRKNNRNTVTYALERGADGQFIAKGLQRGDGPPTKETLQEFDRLVKAPIFADVFLTGTNAVTLDGKLVNTDGFGNRVAPMIFGPSKVIVIAGTNKIVKDVDEAFERIHTFAAPMNARRHLTKHNQAFHGELPCVRTGRCVDCRHEYRICNFTVIIEGTTQHYKGRINVVLVGEELGI